MCRQNVLSGKRDDNKKNKRKKGEESAHTSQFRRNQREAISLPSESNGNLTSVSLSNNVVIKFLPCIFVYILTTPQT